jgi:hypothetical protein
MRHIYIWQTMPAELVPPSFHGLKPSLHEVIPVLSEQKNRLCGLLSELGLSERDIRNIYGMFGNAGSLRNGLVVSHGDLHIGNVAWSGGELAILDWEHVHLNSVYWDLYSLLDMTHPDFRRRTSGIFRYRMLREYADMRQSERWEPDAFFAEYDIFASIYSAWLLLLIDQDLQNGIWNRGRLLLQQAETRDVLLGCLEHYGAAG